jgi:hypothetical protein
MRTVLQHGGSVSAMTAASVLFCAAVRIRTPCVRTNPALSSISFSNPLFDGVLQWRSPRPSVHAHGKASADDNRVASQETNVIAVYVTVPDMQLGTLHENCNRDVVR